MPKRSVLPPALLLAAALALAPAAAASAAPMHYANCAAVHRVYSGGIAKPGVHANRTKSGSRALKGHVKVDSALYAANRGLDRDHDGIACELS